MTAVLATPPFLAFFDADGNPLSGGLIYTYAATTDTPKATYTTAAGTISMPNPIVLDDAGRATWFISGAYKYVIKDSLGNTIKTTDNVTSFSTLADAANAYFQSFSGNGSTTVFTTSDDLGTEEKGLMVFVNSGLVSCVTNGTFATDTGWTKGAGWTIAAGVATATGAISTAISQTSPVTLVAGQAYAVTYTITASAGTLTPSIGGQAGTSRSAAGTYMETIVAGATQTNAFTGAGFTGTLDNVTINIAAPAGFQIQNPSAYTISGTSLTFASAPPTGTNNIYVFAPSLLLGAASSAAALAQTYATAALASQVQADADVVLTHADVVLTHADVVLTHADVVTTGNNATSASSSASTATTQAGIATTQATNAAASAVLAASTFTATSTSSNSVGTGAKTFTTQANKNFQAGQSIKVVDQASSANYMFGTVTSYSGTMLIIDSVNTGGSGTLTAWNISIAGIKGIDGSGTGDVSSNTSSSVDSEVALFSGTGGKTIKRATTTGILKGTSGVISAATQGTDYYAPGGTDVAVADGGTNLSSYTAGDLIYASGTTTLSKLAKGTALQQLRMNAGATAPEWAAGGGLQPQITVFTASGTFTTSANITTSTRFKFTVTGGGAGGATAASNNGSSGSGGGAGGTAIYEVAGLTASTGYTIVVGTGGAATTDGINSTIVIGATTVTGGKGLAGVAGTASNSALGGAGGTATNGTINIVGGAGDAAVCTAATTSCIGGTGGSSAWGGGGRGDAGGATGASAGAAYGSGGGGGCGTAAGGTGKAGIVIAEWFE